MSAGCYNHRNRLSYYIITIILSGSIVVVVLLFSLIFVIIIAVVSVAVFVTYRRRRLRHRDVTAGKYPHLFLCLRQRVVTFLRCVCEYAHPSVRPSFKPAGINSKLEFLYVDYCTYGHVTK